MGVVREGVIEKVLFELNHEGYPGFELAERKGKDFWEGEQRKARCGGCFLT